LVCQADKLRSLCHDGVILFLPPKYDDDDDDVGDDAVDQLVNNYDSDLFPGKL
jgi:hypothetical protein